MRIALSTIFVALLCACIANSVSADVTVVASPSSKWAPLELPDGPPPVKVRADFHLLDLQNIDDDAETFAFAGVLTLTWKDSRQAFDPAVAGVSEIIFSGSYQFNELAPAWYPQVVLANALEVHDMQGVLLRVQPDGSSSLVQTVNAVARSTLNLRRYPFDRQRLEAVFEILGFDDSEVVIESTGGTKNEERLQIPQWDFVSIDTSSSILDAPYAGTGGKSSALAVGIEVERQSFFIMRLVVLPLMIIMALSWAVFWMDRSSVGDRMSVSFVGILTAVAYQTMIGSIMPQISYVTLIHGFLYFSFLLMCATVVVNLVVANHDRRGDFAKGDLIDRRCRWLFPTLYVVLVSMVVSISFTWF